MAKIIAFYLPQYHPIEENDEWWGRGFTEWANTAKARPLFRGHYQPHIPADLGFYDLRVPETRIAQAEMAREYGIEAFCYYHYWFAGKRLLERPFNEVLTSGEPDFPFCLCWANQTWTGIWHGAPDRILIEQTYPGYDDHRKHFIFLLRAFRDRRYVTVDSRPLMLIYSPSKIPEVKKVTNLWREMAETEGLKGLYLVGLSPEPSWVPREHGFDASIAGWLLPRSMWRSNLKPMKSLMGRYRAGVGKPIIHSYGEFVSEVSFNGSSSDRSYPTIVPNWDNTPRSGKNGIVLDKSNPELFRIHLRKALQVVRDLPPEHRIVFAKSWNEWAEGNHLEPDLKFGKAYLEIIREEIFER